MRSGLNLRNGQNEVLSLLIGVLDNSVIPILVQDFALQLWQHSEIQYYIVNLYKNKNNIHAHHALSCILYNMLMFDSIEESLRLRNVPLLPWSQDTLKQMMRLSRFQFTESADAVVYRSHSYQKSMAAFFYTLIHDARYVLMQSDVHRYQRQLYGMLQLPSLLISRPLTDVGTPSVAYLLNAAIVEELIFRRVIQGFFLTAVLKIALIVPNNPAPYVSIPLLAFKLLAQAVLFAASHNSNQSADLARFVAGLVYGALYEISGSVLSPIIAHAAFNFRSGYMLATKEDIYEFGPLLDPSSLIKNQKQFYHNIKSGFFTLVSVLLLRSAFDVLLNKDVYQYSGPMAFLLIAMAALSAYTMKSGSQLSKNLFQMIGADRRGHQQTVHNFFQNLDTAINPGGEANDADPLSYDV